MRMPLIFAEEGSIVRRYSDHLTLVREDSVRRVSLREGAAVLMAQSAPSGSLGILDMSSFSTTGTFKDWVACITIAQCLEKGISEFVTQTSGNTGNALGLYASRQGIKSIILYP